MKGPETFVWLDLFWVICYLTGHLSWYYNCGEVSYFAILDRPQ
jgi:hypothetical protein